MSRRDDIRLRPVQDSDLECFFEHLADPQARHMAAFLGLDPDDRTAFDAHWERLRADEAVLVRTVLRGDEVAGHVVSFPQDDRREVSYWLGREFWGGGLATSALGRFLELETTRPLFARVAADNDGSVRVLDKCGFVLIGSDRGFALARGQEIEELLLVLTGS